MSFSDYAFALKFRDIIQQMVNDKVEEMRPRIQYAVVSTIDNAANKCGVQYPGDATVVQVSMGSIQPSFVGQVVRIAGVIGDRFIDDVLGASNGQVTSGIIEMYGGLVAPTGYLVCNGAIVSRTTYSNLFAAIGTNYGVGDGLTTFGIPLFDLKFPRGNIPNSNGGEATHVLTTAEMPSHTHSIEFANNANPASVQYAPTATSTNSNRYMIAGGAIDWSALATGGGEAHNNEPPFTGVNFIIKT